MEEGSHAVIVRRSVRLLAHARCACCVCASSRGKQSSRPDAINPSHTRTYLYIRMYICACIAVLLAGHPLHTLIPTLTYKSTARWMFVRERVHQTPGTPSVKTRTLSIRMYIISRELSTRRSCCPQEVNEGWAIFVHIFFSGAVWRCIVLLWKTLDRAFEKRSGKCWSIGRTMATLSNLFIFI